MVIRDELYDVGIAQRRAMFGPEGAEDQVDNTNWLNDKIQDFVTRNCFGDIWQRPGLSLADRSKVTFAMLIAAGKPHETRIHARGALANGVSPLELREIAVHAILYCGIPAAVDGIQALDDVLTEKGIVIDNETDPAATKVS